MSSTDSAFYYAKYRPMNNEEFRRYNSAALKSDGFDVPYFPGAFAFGRINPVTRRVNAQEIREMAQAAIDHHNKTNGCNYEMVKIKKATMAGARGWTFYVTFYVKPADLDHPITPFQAQVLRGLPGEPLEIYICRPEPEEHRDLNSLEGVDVEDLN